jgi:hypothetical protein
VELSENKLNENRGDPKKLSGLYFWLSHPAMVREALSQPVLLWAS